MNAPADLVLTPSQISSFAAWVVVRVQARRAMLACKHVESVPALAGYPERMPSSSQLDALPGVGLTTPPGRAFHGTSPSSLKSQPADIGLAKQATGQTHTSG